jgi:hypothetical protein
MWCRSVDVFDYCCDPPPLGVVGAHTLCVKLHLTMLAPTRLCPVLGIDQCGAASFAGEIPFLAAFLLSDDVVRADFSQRRVRLLISAFAKLKLTRLAPSVDQ